MTIKQGKDASIAPLEAETHEFIMKPEAATRMVQIGQKEGVRI